jgi:HPt (histidine-containing phosphotransfer) domain-containing protein
MTPDQQQDAEPAIAAIEANFGPAAPRLLRVFATTAVRDLDLARAHASGGRTEAMSQAAHSLKGAAAVLGLGQIADLADRLQIAQAADAAPLIDGLGTALEAVFATIRRRGHPMDPPPPGLVP